MADAAAVRDVLSTRVAIQPDVRATAAELDGAERAIASLFATLVAEQPVRDALSASSTQGAARRDQLPLCRDLLLSLETTIGIAQQHQRDPND